MDWADYKALCDSPEVVSRWMLVQTLELVALEGGDAALHRVLTAVLQGPPLPKPVDHRGGPHTDMFRLDLTVEDAGTVAALVVRAAAAGRTTTGTQGRGLGGFAEAWQELVQHLRHSRMHEATGNAPPRA